MSAKDENEFDPATMMEVYEITSAEDRENIIQTNKIVVVNNSASWCGPCKQCAPQFATLCKKYIKPGLCALVKEDVDEMFGGAVQVSGVPCFHFYINGKFQEEMTVTGADVKLVETTLQKILY